MPTSDHHIASDRIEALRSFNRFYTQRTGVLAPYLKSDLSLTEVRVLYDDNALYFLVHAYDREPQRINASVKERDGDIARDDLVRIYLYVYQGTTALPDYTLRVTKDGVDMPVSGKSIDAAGFTWPVADPRQRFQNLKVEFPSVQAAGKWEVQLVDSSGAPAGPPATFTLVGGDQNRELYVRYEKP